MKLDVLNNSEDAWPGEPDQPEALAALRGAPPELSGAAPADAETREAAALALLSWAIAKFGPRLIVTTGFGMEGCVLIDLLYRLGPTTSVYYLDTHFLFPETHELRRRLEVRYPGLAIINAGTSLTPEQQAIEHGPELWKSVPDRCCNLRKVEPMRRLLSGADAWLTGLRRSQSSTRAEIKSVEWDARYHVVKINPMAAWSREHVWDYAIAHGVPYNELHERGYPSIGCTHCTRPVEGAGVLDYSRAGRWAGTGKTECGLHWGPPAGEGI